MHERNQDNGVIPGRNDLTQDVEQKKMQVLLCVLNVNSLRQYLKEKFNIPCTHSPYFHLNGKCKNVSTSKKKKNVSTSKTGRRGKPTQPQKQNKILKTDKSNSKLKKSMPRSFLHAYMFVHETQLGVSKHKRSVEKRSHLSDTWH